jgi:sterol 3beta-glucosyltransferase
VRAVGAGPEPLAARRLSAGLTERLGDLVRDEGYRRRAAAIGGLIRAEDGLGQGVTVLERLVQA